MYKVNSVFSESRSSRKAVSESGLNLAPVTFGQILDFGRMFKMSFKLYTGKFCTTHFK